MMSRRVRILLIAVAVIFLVGVAGSFFIRNSPHGQVVQVVQDGRVLYTFDLFSQDDRPIQVEYDGRSNSIQTQDGRIRMLKADCPDHTCIQMGWRNSAVPIVCLPSHLVIQFAPSHDSMDAALR